VEVGDDLTAEVLAPLLGDRPLRSYPAVLSTEADAQAWARAGGPHGAVVVASYQASPRGRGGLIWTVRPEQDLAFSVVLRPTLSAEDEGWLYLAVLRGLADVLGPKADLHWPDELRDGDRVLACAGVFAELGPHGVVWAVATVLVPGAGAPRGALLARLLDAIETRVGQDAAEVRDDYRMRCATLGRHVRARLIPMGSTGPQVTGLAVDCAADGALVLLSATTKRRVAVRPQHLGVLEAAGDTSAEEVPPDITARSPPAAGDGPAPR
jgi:BirA family biotin operon repressor/biotin-[acetyl-CoA-carboxylase] ligase